MNTTSLNPVQLTWVKSRAEGRHELTANGPILGSLQQVGFWKSTSQAEFKEQTWSFQQSRAGKVQILEGAYARPVAEFKTGWLGGGTLSFSDGQQFRLTSKGFWRPVWSWMNKQGHKLLEIMPHNKCVILAEAAGADSSLPQNRLAVLVMLSWHQILQANEEAAVAVAVSAAAAAS